MEREMFGIFFFFFFFGGRANGLDDGLRREARSMPGSFAAMRTSVVRRWWAQKSKNPVGTC